MSVGPLRAPPNVITIVPSRLDDLTIESCRAEDTTSDLLVEIESVGDNQRKTLEIHQEDEPTMSPARKQALRRRWADLIKRVFELDPLRCPCGGTMRVVAFITQPRVIRKILGHLKNKANRDRAPPEPSS